MSAKNKADNRVCYLNSTPNYKSLPVKSGDVVLALGTQVLNQLKEDGILQKNKGITAYQKTWVVTDDGVAIKCSFDPGVRDTDYTNFITLQTDYALAVRYAANGHPRPALGQYEWVDDFDKSIAYLNEQYEATGKPVPISVDLETVGLDPYDPNKWIVSIFVTVKPGWSEGVANYGPDDQPVRTSKLWEQIHWLLNTDRAVTRGANFKYDLGWMREKWGITCSNFKMDTTIVGSLLDENRSNSLNMHTKLYTDLGGYDEDFNTSVDKSRMDLALERDPMGFRVYAGGDTDAGLRVSEAQKKELLRQPKLARFYVNLVHPAARAFEHMEQVGVLVDREYYANLETQLEQEREQLHEKALSMIPHRIRNKYSDNLSLTRKVIIKEFLFSKRGLNIKPQMFSDKTGEPSTAKGHLSMFYDHEEAGPFIRAMEEMNTTDKMLGTYVRGFMSFLRADGRLHPSYMLHKGASESSNKDGGTNTGRTSARDPAIQTVPKHTRHAKILRRGYIAPPGYQVVNWDYSQGELRIAADVANEPTMIETYNAGNDLHTLTGAKMQGLTLEEALTLKTQDKKAFDALRQAGKRGNFGMIYGISAPGFKDYAWSFDGVLMTLEHAEKQRADFFELYDALPKWHAVFKQRARNLGYVESPLGRIRHLPLINSSMGKERSKAERQAVNSPIQATLSDLSQYSLARFHEEYGYPSGCQFFMMCHDAITAYVKEDELDIWIPRVTEVMENLPLREVFDWQPKLAFPVDAEYGPNMADLKDAA